jgi:hypothetical protein
MAMHTTNQFNGSNHNSPPLTEDEPKGLAPTWSVRETRRQFEELGTGPPMSNRLIFSVYIFFYKHDSDFFLS